MSRLAVLRLLWPLCDGDEQLWRLCAFCGPGVMVMSTVWHPLRLLRPLC